MARIYALLLAIAMCNGYNTKRLKLEQVFILSRHNLRAPLVMELQDYTPRIWPTFKETAGKLTQKGVLLESFMAEYITEWLQSEGFLKGCPKQEDVLIYPNTLSRTRDTAKAFAESAFRSCNIPIHHNDNIEIFDPIFLPVYHNNSAYFKRKIIKELKNKIQGRDLKQSYLELNRILDIRHSVICKQKSPCYLSKQNDEVHYQGEAPHLNGPLKIGTDIVDYFLMSYYEGMPLEDVAWGQITTGELWELLTNITRHNLNIRFSSSAAKDMAGPLLAYMFLNLKNGSSKFTMLVGHDCNLSSVIKALGFKEFKLKNQYEPYPIGGKLVFQKWTNGNNKYLKVEYIYQSFSQLRNGVRLSLAQPPERITLELRDCKTDDYGFCLWDDFIKLSD